MVSKGYPYEHTLILEQCILLLRSASHQCNFRCGLSRTESHKGNHIVFNRYKYLELAQSKDNSHLYAVVWKVEVDNNVVLFVMLPSKLETQEGVVHNSWPTLQGSRSLTKEHAPFPISECVCSETHRKYIRECHCARCYSPSCVPALAPCFLPSTHHLVGRDSKKSGSDSSNASP